jgi:UDP-N-acetylglucosamine 2-epimerase (non-hydrolysing)
VIKTKKIMLVFGTRPEAIKMAPLYHALKALPQYFNILLCVTAQHRQMLDQVLDIFDITPDFDLDIMKLGQDLSDISSSVILGMRDILLQNKPDIVLVHGDTSTTLATSIACFYADIPIGHIEAGLRTYDLRAPFPEEFNRLVTSKVTRWHFAPTDLSKRNLLNEHVQEENIFVTGNTVVDALFWILKRINTDEKRRYSLDEFLDKQLNFNWKQKIFILITSHRRENFGSGFLDICNAIKDLAFRYPNIHFVYPVHLNPNIHKPAHLILNGISNISLLKPLDYEPFIYLLKYSYLILTDSGGLQEEAPSLGKPVLLMRDATERPEGLKAGTVRLVGSDRDRIFNNVSELLDNPQIYSEMSKSLNPYGSGNACEKIISALKEINV